MTDRKGMLMWLLIFAFSILAGIAAAFYMAGKLRKTGIFSGIASKPAAVAASVGAVAILVILLAVLFDVTNMIVIMVHLAVFFLLGDLLFVILRLFKVTDNARIIDLFALISCAIYLCIGWYLMHGLWETDYHIFTDKDAGNIKVAHIADSHVGCGFSGEGFGKRLDVINAAKPDVLVITGDFVDDSTKKEDMAKACEALGKFDAKYGVYFCLGNHDMGYYSSKRRGYSGEELIAELEKNNVKVLRDESVLIDDRFYITGRLDAGYGNSDREDIKTLTRDLDDSKYIIVLDHQPTDYEAEQAAGVDLVLSGHTHGGQLFPLEYVQPLLSENDKVRGHEKRGNTDFIVTDGISDWAVKFKTGCRSEYNMITIEGR